jgi:hypothetical protein
MSDQARVFILSVPNRLEAGGKSVLVIDGKPTYNGNSFAIDDHRRCLG